MKKVIKNKKNLIILFIVIIILGLAIYFLIPKKITLKEMENDTYYLAYDNSWKITSKSKDKITLKHNDDGIITIKRIILDDDNKYLSFEELKSKILYQLKENKDYKLITEEDSKLTKNQYDGYKALYESLNSEVLINSFKKSDSLIIICLEAKEDVFDILLDSFNNIVYNFYLKEEQFNYNSSLDISTKKIKYDENIEVKNLLKDTNNYEIASNNYLVNYQLPSNFKLDNFSSIASSFTFQDLEKGSIKINTMIYNRNIYEYIKDDTNKGLTYKYKTYKEDKDYSSYEESLDKLDKKEFNYIYKNSYYYNKATTLNDKLESVEYKRLEENIELIYELNNNHIFVITISSKDVSIPKELITMIKVNSSKNYSSYIKNTKEDDLLVSELKEYSNQTKDKIYSIKVKLPNSYKEIDKNQNIYSYRYFGLNYNKKDNLYEYQINYTLSKTKIEKQIDNMNKLLLSIYGEYNELKQTSNIEINNKTFIAYDGGYTNVVNKNKYYVNKKILFYQMGDYYLTIEIDGNNKQINDKLIKEVTNVVINEEKI